MSGSVIWLNQQIKLKLMIEQNWLGAIENKMTQRGKAFEKGKNTEINLPNNRRAQATSQERHVYGRDL